MGYFNWNPDEPLIDQHPGLYKRLVSNRGGCKCFICPPCSACTSEIDEDEAEELGLVPYPPEHKPKEKEMELKVDFNKLDFPAIQAMIQTPQDQITLQKQVADKVLDRLEIIDPSCIVAGGAPRDWVMGKPASDIDIFIRVPEPHMTATLKQIRKALGSTDISEAAYNKMTERVSPDTNTDKVAQLYRTNPDILFVFNAEVDGVNCQIICMKVPTYQVVDKFPFGICKVWYKNGTIRTTKAFDLALTLKVLVLTGELYNNEDFYVKKMKEKFSYTNGWKFYSSKEQFILTYL